MTMETAALHRAESLPAATAKPTIEAIERIEQISGAVAHDLDNLLSVISNLAELQRGGRGSLQIAEFSRQIIAAAARGALLTRKLRLLGKSGGARDIALAEGLDGISDLMRLSADKNVDVELAIGMDAWPVHVDPSALQLAVVNLAINRGRAMPEGGRFTVTSTNAVLSGERSRQLHIERGDFVEIEVSDTGASMSADTLEKLFDPDVIQKTARGEAALGLAQVRAFALRSRGAVRARSAPGVGTTITLYLPRALSMPGRGPGCPQHGAVSGGGA
jgi:signal transduction histidine kinase